MPVIVVGADTTAGEAIVGALLQPGREVRAFVSDEMAAAGLRQRGVKVALGDVSDESHVEAASTRCFSAVLIAEAADDGRERSFAATAREVEEGWARAISASRVKRAIWVSSLPPPADGADESALVDPGDPNLVSRVIALDDAQTL
ncbi:MAG: NAD(P)H-binding protein [Acidimicrobiia bacterium]